jgi:hypothetical protein
MKRHVRFVSCFIKYKRTMSIILTNAPGEIKVVYSATLYRIYITAFIVAAQRMVWKDSIIVWCVAPIERE